MKFSISIEELNELMKNNSINIIDIRDKYQYLMEHIPTAISVPKQLLTIMPEEFLNKQEIYYLYCNYGVTSRKVRDELLKKGYNVVSIDGGLIEYKSINY